jgi:hypothetical protein
MAARAATRQAGSPLSATSAPVLSAAAGGPVACPRWRASQATAMTGTQAAGGGRVSGGGGGGRSARAVASKHAHEDDDDDSEEDDAVETDKVRVWTARWSGAPQGARRCGPGRLARELFLEQPGLGPFPARTLHGQASPPRRALTALHRTRVGERRLPAVRSRRGEGSQKWPLLKQVSARAAPAHEPRATSAGQPGRAGAELAPCCALLAALLSLDGRPTRLWLATLLSLN